MHNDVSNKEFDSESAQNSGKLFETLCEINELFRSCALDLKNSNSKGNALVVSKPSQSIEEEHSEYEIIQEYLAPPVKNLT